MKQTQILQFFKSISPILKPDIKPVLVSKPNIKTLEIYTDGSCLNNGKPNARGGYGIHFPNCEYADISESYKNSEIKPTNQRCELLAIYRAILLYVDYNTKIGNNINCIIYTDSEYSIKCLTQYCRKWEQNNWKKTNNTPPENLDILQPLYSVYWKNHLYINLIHVRAHTGKSDLYSVYNAIVDNLAKQGALKTKCSEN